VITEEDARGRLAAASRVELLLFRLGGPEQYGINVAEVREVMRLPALTRVPETGPRIAGVANIRGALVPVINLLRVLAAGSPDPAGAPGAGPAAGIVIIAESRLGPHGFLVAKVDRIMRVPSSRVKAPPALLRDAAQGAVTAVAVLEDGGMILVLDIEKVLDA
jgi:two-component system chemotaxis response regulator CheV